MSFNIQCNVAIFVLIS